MKEDINVNDFLKRKKAEDKLKSEQEETPIINEKARENINVKQETEGYVENFKKNVDDLFDTPKKSSNNISMLLKYISIIGFIFCLFGSTILSNKEKIEYKKGLFSYDEPEIVKTEEFSLPMFIGINIASGISCTILYAFGELIQLQQNNNDILKTLISKKEEE